MANQPVNPYVAGAPLRGGQHFFGRQDVLDWVARELRNPSSNAIVLFGQRRIGKTSLLLQLEHTLPADVFLPIYFDLQDQATRSLGQVLADLADTIAERLDLNSPEPDDFDDRGRFFRREFLPQFYRAVESNIRPVFLLDEFDVLDQVAEAELPESAAAKSLFPFLRRVMAEDPRPAFVFVVGRRAEDLSLDFTAIFKASLVREIWVLDRESAEKLVLQAESNGTLRFTDQAVKRILELTNCHPYLTQLLCQRLWERAWSEGKDSVPPCVDVPEVESAIPDALTVGDQALSWLWSGLSPAEKIYAAALAEVAEEGETIPEDQVIQILSAHAVRLRTREVEMAPRDLVKRRVLSEVGEREYRFAVELFRLWVRQHKPLRDVKEELDQIEPVAHQLYRLGVDYFRRREWKKAANYFQEALSGYPAHFQARLHLGEALLELGQVDEAVAELERAYEQDRDDASYALIRALLAQAKARERAGDEEGALSICERVLQISPRERAAYEMQAAIWTRRGDQAIEQGNLEAALTAYQRAGATGKVAQVEALQKRQALDARKVEAQSHEQAERWAEAAAIYTELLDRAPDEQTRAEWQAALNRCQEEEELARLFTEGVGALKQKDWKRAQRALSEVVYRRPDYRKGKYRAVQLLERAVARRRPVSFSLPRWARRTMMGTTVILAILIILTLIWPSGAVISPGNAMVVRKLRSLEGHTSAVKSVAFSPDGKVLASGANDRTVQLWRTQDGALLQTIGAHADWVRSVAFSPDGTMLASASDDRMVRLWQVSDGRMELLRTLEGHSDWVSSVAFSPDGTLLASGASDKTVRLWQVADGVLLRTFRQPAAIWDVAFSPDGEILAAGSLNGTVRLWRVSDGTLLRTLEGHTSAVRSVAFSPDGTLLASGSWDRSVRLWRVSDGVLLRTLQGHESWVSGVVFSPDGTLLASGAWDKSVLLWRVSDGALLRTLEGHGSMVYDVAFSPDGTILASGSEDKTVILWGVQGWLQRWLQ